MARCKECGNELVVRRNKAGEKILYCTECGKVYKMKQQEEAKPRVEDKPQVEQKPKAKRCPDCGNVLVKKTTKSGADVLYCPECREIKVRLKAAEVPQTSKKERKEEKQDDKRNSYFDGGLLQKIGWTLLGLLITVITFGICYPWALCMLYNWETKHTVIEGKRLAFDGNGGQLLGKWIVWLLLTLITFGIYGLWVPIRIKQWITKHTYFSEEE